MTLQARFADDDLGKRIGKCFAIKDNDRVATIDGIEVGVKQVRVFEGTAQMSHTVNIGIAAGGIDERQGTYALYPDRVGGTDRVGKGRGKVKVIVIVPIGQGSGNDGIQDVVPCLFGKWGNGVSHVDGIAYFHREIIEEVFGETRCIH